MFQDLSLTLVVFALPVIALCVLTSLASWTSGFRLMILELFFGGIVAMNVANGALGVAFRELFIVVPLYVALFMSPDGLAAARRLPTVIGLALFAIVACVLVGLLNSFERPLLQVIVGLKVWLLYLPFVVVGITLAARPQLMFSMFRFMLVTGLVVCAFGLVEAVLVRSIGYRAAITPLYGAGAAAATQGFAYFDDAGGIYRIPATFSYGAQYFSFLYFFLALTIVEANADPEPKYRKLGEIGFFVVVVAFFLSGSRGAPLGMLGMLGSFAAFRLLGSRMIMYAPVGALAGLYVLRSVGFDPTASYQLASDLAVQYAQGFVRDQLADSLAYGPLGIGLGASTGAARYFVPGVSGYTSASPLGFESYFAKIASEMGWIGLGVFVAVFITIGIYILVVILRHRKRRTIALIVPMASYIALNLVMSLKGYVLDVDPTNIFFWLFLGLIIGIDQEATQRARAAFAHALAAGRAAVWKPRTAPAPIFRGASHPS